MATSESTLKVARQRVVQYAVVVVVIGALAWAFGTLMTPEAGAALFFALFGLSYVTAQSGQIDVPFVLSFVAGLLLLAEFALPGFVTGAFDPFVAAIGGAIGIDLRSLDAVQFAVLAVAAILTIWVVKIRLYGRAKKPDTIVKRVRTRAEKLADTYLTIGRLIAGFGLMVVVMFFSQAGELAGEAGTVLAEVPFVAANVVTAVLGFVGLGGEVPILSDIPIFSEIGPAGFLALVVLVVGAAAAVRWSR